MIVLNIESLLQGFLMVLLMVAIWRNSLTREVCVIKRCEIGYWVPIVGELFMVELKFELLLLFSVNYFGEGSSVG